MALKVLLNSTRVGTVVHFAGSHYDEVKSAWEIPGILEAGGKLIAATAEVLTASAIATKCHEQGASIELLDSIMFAHALSAGIISYDDTLRAPPLGVTNAQAAIDELKQMQVATSAVSEPFTTTGMTDGDFGYFSAEESLTKTDAASIATSRFAGAHIGMANLALIHGIVNNAKFSELSPTPVIGEPAFLARADDEAGNGAAGKLSALPAWPVVAEVGLIAGVDPVLFPTSRTAKVLLQPKAIMVRS
jgi:hypothetical protein